MKKENLFKPAVVLTCICLIVSVLLAGVNMLTKPVIEKAEADAADKACCEVMPEGEGFSAVDIPAEAPATVKGLWRETTGKGWTVKLVTNGFSAGYQIMCGISSDGKITGTQVLSHNETEGYGSRTKDDPSYAAAYIGLDAAGVDGNKDLLLSGATKSSTAYRAAIADAFSAVALLSEGETK